MSSAEPLILTRSYCADYTNGNLGYNWQFNRPHPIIISDHHKTLKTRLHLSSGGKAFFKNKKHGTHSVNLKIDDTRGLTNCRSGGISGRTNLHNLRMKINSKKEKCEVTTGSGHLTFYVLDNSLYSNFYHLNPKFERKANGNLLLFEKHAIISANHDQSIDYGQVKWQSEGLEKLTVTASNGNSASYAFDSYQSQEPPPINQPDDPWPKKQKPPAPKKYCLVKADYTHKPQIEYEYDHPPHEDPVKPPPNPLLKKKKWQNNRFQEVGYYQSGKNEMEGFEPVVLHRKDFRLHRVKEIRAPVDQSSPNPVVTHRFIYQADDLSAAKKGKSYSGRTEVYNAYQNKTVYAYNKEHRPIAIEKYRKNNQLYSKENYVWDEGHQNIVYKLFNGKVEDVSNEDDEEEDAEEMVTEGVLLASNDTIIPIRTSIALKKIKDQLKKKKAKSKKTPTQIGNLLGKYLSDENGHIQHAHFFMYDAKGNIEKERFYGNLTGTKAIPLLLTIEGLSKGELYEKQFTYSGDGYNHLISEQEGNGKRIEYVYNSETQQVASKYIKDGQKIKFRQFCFYDPDTAALNKVIQDDGSTEKWDNFTDVKVRLITEMTLCKASSEPIGLPQEVIEKYWDGNGEKLLKKIVNHYKKGKITRQDHYDSKNTHRYSLYWEYDAHGNLTKETNALGYEIEKKYDLNDNLIAENGPFGSKTYNYDYSNRLTSVDYHADYQNFITDYSYDLLGNRTTTRDAFKNETHYRYDEFNRLIEIEQPSIQSSHDILMPITKTSYDVNGNPISITQPGGYTTEFSYNARGKPLSKKHPDGRTEKFQYNLDGTLSKCIDPYGRETTYKRDFLGRIIEEKTFDGTQDVVQTFVYKGSCLVSKKDGEGAVTEYAYDGAGRLVSERCDNFLKIYSYDTLGRVQKISQKYGDDAKEECIQVYEYDFLNQVTEERLEDGKSTIIQRTKYKYDNLGNRIKTTLQSDAGERVTTIVYNKSNQPILATDAEGHQTHYVYTYDHVNSLGQYVLRVDITDPKGRITRQIYDPFGRLSEISQTDPLGNTILSSQKIHYDLLGRQIQTIDAVFENGVFQRDYINQWQYYFNEKVQLIIEGVGTEKQKRTQWNYLEFGKKEELIKPDGLKITCHYDPLGRLKEIHSKDGTIHDLYTYDRCHRVTQVEDRITQTNTKRKYDLNGLKIEETLGNGLKITYDYDRMGRLKALKLPDKSSIQYSYNSVHLKKVQRTRNEKMPYQHEFSQYDLSGSLKQSTMIGVTGTLFRNYDKMGRIKEINTPHWTLHIPDGAYDPTACLQATTIQDPVGNIQLTYTYNNLDHLASEQGHTSLTYKTDSLQNRLSKNEKMCVVNAHNQLTSHYQSRYTYDDNGNLIKKEDPTGETLYKYDALDRLVSVTSPKGETTTYSYDAFNRRLSKTQQGVATRYLYQGQNEIGCVNEKDEITELRILAGGDASERSAIALELYGDTYTPIHDQQGNVVCLIDAFNGRPVETYRYTAFGEETLFNAKGEKISTSEVGNPWRFASKRADPETGWIYFGRRYYDPETGRWTTPDPIGFADGPNLYAYLHHHPLNGIDPYGLLGEAYRDFCKPEFSKAYFAEHSSPDNSPSFYSRSERSESSNPGIADLAVQSGQAFAHGFVYGMENPCKVALESSAIGLFVNYLNSTQQADFHNYEPPGHTIVHFCDKAGEVCGSYVMLRTLAETVRGAGALGYSWLMRREASQLAYEGVTAATATRPTMTTTTAGQVISEEIACVEKEIIQLIPQDSSRKTAEFLFRSWDKGTFPNRLQSIKYHVQKHGNNRSYEQYTQDALDFYKLNKEKATNVNLKNGKNGYSIKSMNSAGRRTGGFWTEEGEIITFWD